MNCPWPTWRNHQRWTTPFGATVNGVVTLKMSTLAKGSYSIYAIYSGDSTHQGSTSGTIALTIT